MKIGKIVEGDDGYVRKFFYKDNEYFFCKALAKDFQESFTINPTAEEILKEVKNAI